MFFILPSETKPLIMLKKILTTTLVLVAFAISTNAQNEFYLVKNGGRKVKTIEQGERFKVKVRGGKNFKGRFVAMEGEDMLWKRFKDTITVRTDYIYRLRRQHNPLAKLLGFGVITGGVLTTVSGAGAVAGSLYYQEEYGGNVFINTFYNGDQAAQAAFFLGTAAMPLGVLIGKGGGLIFGRKFKMGKWQIKANPPADYR